MKKIYLFESKFYGIIYYIKLYKSKWVAEVATMQVAVELVRTTLL